MNEAQTIPDRQSKIADHHQGAPSEPTVVFVSDSHFHLKADAAERARLERFLELLELAQTADELVLLGDVFDFWFDYPHFRLKGYEPLLQGLDRVREAGTRIRFIGGNHDIWAADYFHRRYGTSPDGAPAVLQYGSRRVLLDHGDGLLKFDWAYNSFRAVVRTRAGIFLAKSLHPELLFALSTWLSGRSRAANRDEASQIERRAERWFQRQVAAPVGAESAPPWDLMLMGHVHHAFVLTAGRREFAALGGWFDPLSYGLLRDGRFELLEFGSAPRPQL